jgi:hypothetical protein
LVKIHRNTACRYARLARKHAEQIHDALVAFSSE